MDFKRHHVDLDPLDEEDWSQHEAATTIMNSSTEETPDSCSSLHPCMCCSCCTPRNNEQSYDYRFWTVEEYNHNHSLDRVCTLADLKQSSQYPTSLRLSRELQASTTAIPTDDLIEALMSTSNLQKSYDLVWVTTWRPGPINEFLRILLTQNKVRSLRIQSDKLEDLPQINDLFQSLEQGLVSNTSLCQLDLQYMRLSGSQGQALGNALFAAQCLDTINLETIVLQDANAIVTLGQALAQIRSLSHVSLWNTIFDDSNVATLVQSLTQNPSLMKSITIHSGDCGHETFSAFAVMLQLPHQQLSTLNISKPPLLEQEVQQKSCVVPSFFKSLETCRHLSNLYLFSLGLTDQDMHLLAASLRSLDQLVLLNIMDNCIGDAGIVILAPSLPHGLQTLDIRANVFSHDGVISMCASIPPKLKQLYLTRSDIGQQGEEALLNMVHTHVELEQLQFTPNSQLFPKILFYLCLNRAGRRAMQQYVSIKLWPKILERAASLECTDDELDHLSHFDDSTLSEQSYQASTLFTLLKGPILLEQRDSPRKRKLSASLR